MPQRSPSLSPPKSARQAGRPPCQGLAGGMVLRTLVTVVILMVMEIQILLEMARRRTVGGQEDLIEGIAIEMAAAAKH